MKRQVQACRRLEVFYLSWHECLLQYKRALSAATEAYFSPLISNNKHSPRFLFDTVAKFTKRQPSISCSPIMAHKFLDFFCNKVDEIRYKISSLPSATPAEHVVSNSHLYVVSQIVPVLTDFETISLETLTKLVSASKSTTCLLDPLPAKPSKDLLPFLGATMLNIVNLSHDWHCPQRL